MLASLKRKWVKALLSGRYEQDVMGLHDRGYCCLGVLADIQGCRWRGGKPYLGKEMISSDDSATGYLRPKFAGGLTRKTQDRLADMNDNGASFPEIADYVKRRL